jgi:hypothetical protein
VRADSDLGWGTRITERESSSRATVAMMQPADLWNSDHLSFRGMLDSTWHWCITFQRKMRACFVIVREVAAENSSQVGFVDYDDIGEALSADTAVQAFNVRILPWRSWCYCDFFDSHVLDTLAEELA